MVAKEHNIPRKVEVTSVLDISTRPNTAQNLHQAFMQRNKFNVLEWPFQSPDLIIIKNLWIDLKQPVHAQQPSNLTELEMPCKEEYTFLRNPGSH